MDTELECCQSRQAISQGLIQPLKLQQIHQAMVCHYRITRPSVQNKMCKFEGLILLPGYRIREIYVTFYTLYYMYVTLAVSEMHTALYCMQ